MSDFTKIVDLLSNLTVIQAAELAKILEEKWGVTAAAPVAVAAVPTAMVAESAAEKTTFEVVLVSAGERKIEVIKAVKGIIGLGLGLKEAKDFVDAAPKQVKANISKEEAEEIKTALEAAGAKVELK